MIKAKKNNLFLGLIWKHVKIDPIRIFRLIRLLLLSMAIFWSVSFFLNLLKISSISCTTQYGQCSEQLYERLNVLREKRIFEIKQGKINALIQPNNLLESKKVFPNKLNIIIDIPKPAVIVDLPDDQEYFVTDEGVVLGYSSGQNLPRVNATEAFKPIIGETISDYQIFQAVRLANELEKAGFTNPTIKTDGQVLEIENISSIKIVSNSDQDPVKTATTLQSLLPKVTIDNNPPKIIDLRFTQPILSY